MLENLLNQTDLLLSKIHDIDNQIKNEVGHLFEKKDQLNSELNLLQEKVNEEIRKKTFDELSGKDYKCGTVNIVTDHYKIKSVVSKKVSWDENILRSVRDKIIAAGKNPHDFINEKLSVHERKYDTFTDEIKKEFLPARTVEASTPKIEIVRK